MELIRRVWLQCLWQANQNLCQRSYTKNLRTGNLDTGRGTLVMCTHREDRVSTQEKDGHQHSKETGLRRNQTGRYFENCEKRNFCHSSHLVCSWYKHHQIYQVPFFFSLIDATLSNLSVPCVYTCVSFNLLGDKIQLMLGKIISTECNLAVNTDVGIFWHLSVGVCEHLDKLPYIITHIPPVRMYTYLCQCKMGIFVELDVCVWTLF